MCVIIWNCHEIEGIVLWTFKSSRSFWPIPYIELTYANVSCKPYKLRSSPTNHLNKICCQTFDELPQTIWQVTRIAQRHRQIFVSFVVVISETLFPSNWASLSIWGGSSLTSILNHILRSPFSNPFQSNSEGL